MLRMCVRDVLRRCDVRCIGRVCCQYYCDVQCCWDGV